MSYYAGKLSGKKLQRCYEIASPRVQQYLEAEIRHIVSRLRPEDIVLELGCGYGRIALRLAAAGRRVIGIDTAKKSIEMARRLAASGSRCGFLAMDAVHLGFTGDAFDTVVCAQNGVCAFGVDPETLVREALRVTRPGGRVLFSTYSDRFWPDRLAWFESQAAEGLLGAVDLEASGNGFIVCQDGFRSGRMTPEDLRLLCARIGVEPGITEVDGSSIFCEIVVPASGGIQYR